MPAPFELAEIAVPEGTEVAAFLEAYPDLACMRFGDDEFLVRQGDDTDNATYLLLRGSCLVEYGIAEVRQPGHELAILSAEPDRPLFVGEMSYLGTGIRCASVRSTMNTYAVRLKPDHMDQIIERYPGLTRQLCRQFAERLQESLRQLQRFREEQALEATQVYLKSGDVLVEAGTPAETVYQLVVGVLVGSAGESIRVRPGVLPLVGLGPYLRGGSYPETITCQTGCILVAIGSGARLAVIRNFPDQVLGLL
ncbi:MAG: hypothetical protein IT368_10245 [Candidatus Hydrogenedentes bacterium]|nr:hypothetical protein [Candidatus Hydrogenedentota bacterium]